MGLRVWVAVTTSLIVTLMGGSEAFAASEVFGANDTVSALEIAPDFAPATVSVDSAGAEPIAFIQSMPRTKLVNRVTVGDIAQGASCGGDANLRLGVFDQSSGNPDPGGGQNSRQLAFSEPLAAPASLGRMTFQIPPVTLVSGRSYLFEIDRSDSTSCRDVQIRTWAHNNTQVDVGPPTCALPMRIIGSGSSGPQKRMFHSGGVNDVNSDCVSSGVSWAFSPSMPGGWLVTEGYSLRYVVSTNVAAGDPVPASFCPSSEGQQAVFWKTEAGSDYYVCRYTQFANPGQSATDGWYYGGPSSTAVGGGPRDTYLKLDLDQAALAGTYRPWFRFDDDEHYRPLDVDSFFAETYPSGAYSAHHQVCNPDNSICEQITDPGDLASHPGWHLDVASMAGDGTDENESDYQTPGCPQGQALRDCDSGPTNALYYQLNRPLTDSGYTFIDYWTFYRLDDKNDLSSEDHEGDWEGMTVAPSRTHGGTFDFASFAQHGTWWSYLRGNLKCHDQVDRVCPETPTYKAGARIESYVATGTHATYPDACTNTPILSCGKNGQSPPRYEADHDGDAEWAANGEASMLEPSVAGWWLWNGTWGKFGAPVSPGLQSHFFKPRDEHCAEGNDGCPTYVLGARAPRRPSRSLSAVTRNRQASTCSRWFGAGITALACDPRGLRTSVRNRTLRARSSFRLMRRSKRRRGRTHVRQSAATRSLAQLAGRALRKGDHLVLKGRMRGPVRLFVRILIGRRLVEATFAVPPSRTRWTLSRRSGGGGSYGLVLTRRGKRSLRPYVVRNRSAKPHPQRVRR